MMHHYPGHGLISSITKLLFFGKPYIILGGSEMPGFSSNLIKPQGSFFTRFTHKEKVGFQLPS